METISAEKKILEISDEELFYGIADKTIDRAEMIYRCMKIKAEVVTEDEFEHGRRAILNYGHTLGHAVEKLGGFERFSHGESVGIGMLYAARVGAAFGYDAALEEKIAELDEDYLDYKEDIEEELVEIRDHAERLENIVEDFEDEEPEE